MRIPTDFVKIEPSVQPGADPGLISQVFFADTSGARYGDTALDVLSVAVRRLSTSAKPGDLERHKAEFEAIASQLIGKPKEVRFVAPFTLSTLGGLPALRSEYVFKVGDVDVAAVAYLLPVGDRVYWITGQTSKDTWPTSGRLISASLDTLSLKD
jgi:hypothetical protein